MATRQLFETLASYWHEQIRLWTQSDQTGIPFADSFVEVSKANVAIGQLRKLHRNEDNIRDLVPEQKRQQRRKLSMPLQVDFKAWQEKNAHRAQRQSGMQDYSLCPESMETDL